MGKTIETIIIELIITRLEKGYVDHPQDAGGPTKFGVSQQLLTLTKRPDVIKDMTFDRAAEILHNVFVPEVRADKIKDVKLKVFVLSLSMLMGSGTMTRLIQDALMLVDDFKLQLDGIMGPKTIAAINQCNATHRSALLLSLTTGLVMNYLVTIVRNAYAHEHVRSPFIEGWINRVIWTLQMGVDVASPLKKIALENEVRAFITANTTQK